MRRLIFCFDGSWNKLSRDKEPTNVVLISEAILPIDRKNIDQIVYYDEGVGTASDEIWRGGIFGKGVRLNIREAYRFLVFNFQPDDEIFVFGFSRGAFTALSFIGFIRCAGIVNVSSARHIDEAWDLYKKFARRIDDDPPEIREFRALHCPNLCVDEADLDWRLMKDAKLNRDDHKIFKIRYVGVWDTVGSLGAKVIAAFFDRRTNKQYRQHDTNLSMTVEAGRHAVAIDEKRVFFMPTLWNNVRNLNALREKSHYDPDAPYQQKWFPGDHGSVGGGGIVRGLSNASLHWVLDGAVDQGLAVRLEGRSQLRDIRYNQRAALRNTPITSWMGWLADLAKRIFVSASRSGPEEISDIHNAALRRWFTLPGDLPERKAYRPRTLQALKTAIETLAPRFLPMEVKGTEASTIEHQIEPEETLSKLAKRYLGDAQRYPEIFALNPQLDSPHHVFPGDTILIPKETVSPDSVAASDEPDPR